MFIVIMFLIGVISALIGSLVGLGGGLVFVPALLFLSQYYTSFDWVTPQTVVAMSLLLMVFTGLSATLTYLKAKRVDLHSGSLFLIGSIPGAIIGVALNQHVQVDAFELYFGILMLVLSAMFFIKDRITKITIPTKKKNKRFYISRTLQLSEDNKVTYSYSIILAVSIAFVVGMISGLFGIGGGSLMVTAMILLFGIPVHIAAPTSMFMIFVSSIVSSGAHIFHGNVLWIYALASIPGVWLGGYLGAKLNQKLESNIIEWILRILMIIIGIRLII